MSFGRLSGARRAEPMSEINVTPLVDVMLVLLVIFIVAAPLMAGRLALQLPQAQATVSGLPATALRVAMDARGAVTLNDQPVTDLELRQQLQATGASRPDTEVLLLADATVPYGRVAAFIGMAQAAGLSRIGFVGQPPAAEPR